MKRSLFHVIGLLLGTFALLAFALALYDLSLQLATKSNLFSTASTTTITWPQIQGQVIFTFLLFLVGVFVLYVFKDSENGVIGEERGVKDADLIRNSGVSAFASTQPPTSTPI